MLNNPFKKYFCALDQLQKLIFSFYIKRNFGENRFLHEKKLIQCTSRVMRAMQSVRLHVKDDKSIAQAESLYEIIFSLDLLKNRLTDHATFEICETELKKITQTLSAVFSEIQTTQPLSTKPNFDAAIQALEIVFQNTLQVVSADPLIFLFFIRALYALSQRLNRTNFA